MTRHPTDTPSFYLTAPADCPYLPERKERKVFTHLVGENADAYNAILSQGGFRRSQSIAYRPACENCKACVSVRVVVDQFDWTRSFRRVMGKNSDLLSIELPAQATPEQYRLFRDYLDSRHADGGMADMSVFDYMMMIEDTHVETRIVELRERAPDSGISGKGGRLVGVSLTDILPDGLSMVYAFFDPGEERRSLGTFMILDHIRKARQLGLPYLYLGYWIEGSRKMEYKRRFQPQEDLTATGWLRAPASPV